MLRSDYLQRRLKAAPFSQEFKRMLAPEREIKFGIYHTLGKITKLTEELLAPHPQFTAENYRKAFGRKARAAAKADAWRHALALKKLVEMRAFPPGTEAIVYRHGNGTQPFERASRPALCVQMPALRDIYAPGAFNNMPPRDAKRLRRQARKKTLDVTRYFCYVDSDVKFKFNWGLHSDGNLYLFDLHGIPRLSPTWKSPDGKIPTLAEAVRRFECLKPPRGRRKQMRFSKGFIRV